jgi:hypothetical protein
MKKPKEFDMDFKMTFKTQHGKNAMALIFMEFLGTHYYPPHTDDCYKSSLDEIYRAIKNAEVEKNREK